MLPRSFEAFGRPMFERSLKEGAKNKTARYGLWPLGQSVIEDAVFF